ncbi:hypothetical protein AB0J21_25280 [Streptomyces sp. NPDC049954]|uniref:hypothetical protein n=1 Tax=Streptomyces sp. NPDC049954 TaxID=3155779 RepID=UPI003415EC85
MPLPRLSPPKAPTAQTTSGPGTPPPTPPPPREPHQDVAAGQPARRLPGTVDLRPGPHTGAPFVRVDRPEHYDDTTTRLRPVGRRVRPGTLAAATCAVLGLGLIGGALAGSWLRDEQQEPAPPSAYEAAAELWHSTPVDTLFPRVVQGRGAGPGGADRTWNRIAVAPDSGCADAFDPLLRKALAPVGCLRLLRATYTDATRSHVTTVGLLFTKGDSAAMKALHARFTTEGLDRRTDLLPLPYARAGTPAAGFGPAQRASWTLTVRTDLPLVVYAVSGFADARPFPTPVPAALATKAGAGSTVAQAGLGHDAQGLADHLARGVRAAAPTPSEPAP